MKFTKTFLLLALSIVTFKAQASFFDWFNPASYVAYRKVRASLYRQLFPTYMKDVETLYDRVKATENTLDSYEKITNHIKYQLEHPQQVVNIGTHQAFNEINKKENTLYTTALTQHETVQIKDNNTYKIKQNDFVLKTKAAEKLRETFLKNFQEASPRFLSEQRLFIWNDATTLENILGVPHTVWNSSYKRFIAQLHYSWATTLRMKNRDFNAQHDEKLHQEFKDWQKEYYAKKGTAEKLLPEMVVIDESILPQGYTPKKIGCKGYQT